MTEFVFPCSQEEIKKVLPHRDPFLWVSRVLSCDPGRSIVAELDVAEDLAIFEGHFPSYPVFPGVLIMEALAQAASFCVLLDRQSEGAIGFLTGIEEARFREQVRPGDTIRLEAVIVKSSSRMCVARVEAYVGDKQCASAVQKYVMAHSREASS